MSGPAVSQAISVKAPDQLVQKIRELNNGLADGAHIVFRGQDGKEHVVSVQLTSNGYKLESLDGSRSVRDAIENPERIFVGRTVGSFLDLPFLSEYSKNGGDLRKLGVCSTYYEDVTEFKDPIKDFRLLMGQYVQVEYLDKYDETQYAFGLVGKGSDIGIQETIAILDRACNINFTPSERSQIKNIQTFIPHREFGGKHNKLNDKDNAFNQYNAEQVFRESFPIGSEMLIPMSLEKTNTDSSRDPVTGRMIYKDSIEKTNLDIKAKVLGYSDIKEDNEPKTKLLLSISKEGKEYLVAVRLENLLDMTRESDQTIKTVGYNANCAKGTTAYERKNNGLNTSFNTIQANYPSSYQNFNHGNSIYTIDRD
jgi:hypothetical protein